jgi:hypothetical protein
MKILDDSAEREELDEKDMYKGLFIGGFAKSYKVLLLVSGVFMLAFAIFAYAVDDGGSRELSFLLFAIDAFIWLLALTAFSYRVEISKDMIAEQYLIVFVTVRREIKWSDVKYKKIKQNDSTGNPESIKLYNEFGKKVMTFDRGTIGFSRILKLAKRSAIKDIDKK